MTLATLARAALQLPIRRPTIGRLALAGVPLSTGAALVAFIVLGVPMSVAALLALGMGSFAWIVVLPQMTSAGRHEVGRRAAQGALVAPFALLAYDATRYGVVAVASMSFQPFHVFPLFGHALLGPGISEPVAVAAGVAFHVANGTGFAIAFALVVSRPTAWRGIAWALCLEAAMLLLYPGWLGTSLVGEIVPVSLSGHLAYGAVLGTALSRFSR